MPDSTTIVHKVGNALPFGLKPITIKLLNLFKYIRIDLQGRAVQINPAPIIILGNQKSGTSAIAALLGMQTGLATSVDLIKEYLSTGETYKKIKSGQMSFDCFIKRNRLDFSRPIIKEANLTTFYQELRSYFPHAKFVFVIRDPRDNIRSILNRHKLPGSLEQLSAEEKKTLKTSWNIVFDGTWLGLDGRNYIEMLALRWNLLTGIYLENKNDMILISYEKFLANKIEGITQLTKKLGLAVKHDISSKVDIQFQPAGNKKVDLTSFYGTKNLQLIEDTCHEYMKLTGYVL